MVAGHNLDARQQGMEIKSSKRIHVLNSIGGMAIYAAQVLDVFNIQYIFNSSANTVPRQKANAPHESIESLSFITALGISPQAARLLGRYSFTLK